MNVPKYITLYTSAVGGAWLGSTLYYSQNTYIHEKHDLRGWMTFTFIGGLSGLILTHKYCKYAGKL